jgi:hypothetical protein
MTSRYPRMNHQTRCPALTFKKTTRATPTSCQIQIAAPAILPDVLNEVRTLQFKHNRLQTTFDAIKAHRIQSIVPPLPKSQFAHHFGLPSFVNCQFWESSTVSEDGGFSRGIARPKPDSNDERISKILPFEVAPSRSGRTPSNVASFSIRSHNIGCFGSVCETRSAHYRSALSRLEWNSCVAPAS